MTLPYQDWHPSAALSTLMTRAECYRKIRQFFFANKILEVDTPILGMAATVDPFIDSLRTTVNGERRYLQTSPEFYLKRLLAAYKRDVFTLGKVFRQGEKGQRHHPEFTMLEWYRIGWHEHQLMGELYTLLQLFFPSLEVSKFSYKDVFTRYLNIDPHQASVGVLSRLATSFVDIELSTDDRSLWLDVLMTHCIEPKLPKHLVFIYDYPQSQAALAELGENEQGQTIARRFEAYLNGIELANGYFELNDPLEQKERFEQDQQYRQENNLPYLPYDHHLIDALISGMPICSGVALGVDRLLMILCGEECIEQVLSYPC